MKSAPLKLAEISVKSSNMLGKKYKWEGFDIVPAGCLLEQIIDLSQDMGFAYERSTQYFKDFHTHDRLMLIFPRGSSVMEVRTKNPHNKYTVDYETVLFVPKGLVHDDEGMSSIFDTTAFYPSDSMIETAAQKIGLTSEQLQKFTTECIKIPRSSLVDTIFQAYFFERVILSKNKNEYDHEATKLLGRRLLEEIMITTFFPERERSMHTEMQGSEDPNEPVSVRALRYIEANLFEPLELEDIAKKAHGSVSTLLRKFKADVGMTPYTYIKNRRLEEALRLLKTGQHPVGDVALLVGYENFGAFSDAFKEKFGDVPSSVKLSS
jgi:AraC-like DNA-binding protein